MEQVNAFGAQRFVAGQMHGILQLKIRIERGADLQGAVDQLVRQALSIARLGGIELDPQITNAPWLQPYLADLELWS